MKNIPTKIYLQVENGGDVEDFNDIATDGSVSWCADIINDSDIAYLKEETVMDVFSWLLGYNNFTFLSDRLDFRSEFRQKLTDSGIEFKPPAK